MLLKRPKRHRPQPPLIPWLNNLQSHGHPPQSQINGRPNLPRVQTHGHLPQSQINGRPNLPRVQTTNAIYKGYNIHAYTSDISEAVRSSYLFIVQHWGDYVHERTFNRIIAELNDFFGPKPVYDNLRSAYDIKAGTIHDPQVPKLNAAVLLEALWLTLKRINDPSTYAHFNETLNQIGTTCIQGITHRLFIDYMCIVHPFLQQKRPTEEK